MKIQLILLPVFFFLILGCSGQDNVFPYTIVPYDLVKKECFCEHGNFKATYLPDLSLRFNCQCLSFTFKEDTLLLPDCYFEGKVRIDSDARIMLRPSITPEQEKAISNFKETLLKNVVTSDTLSILLAQDLDYLVKSMKEKNIQKYKAVLNAFEKHLALLNKDN